MRISKGIHVCALLAIASPAFAQMADSGNAVAGNRKLAFVIPDLFGPGGLTLPNPTHNAHFDSAFQSNFVPFNTAIASQLTSLAIPSPASGFTYSFDKSLGIYSRSAQSFGPILAERAETIGKDKIYFGFSYQHFRFDSIDGIDLHNVPVLFQHAPAQNPNFQKDLITTNNNLDIRIGQFTMFFTYGLTDRLDLSVAVPQMSATFSAVSNAKIQRIGTADEDCSTASTTCAHFFNTTIGDRSQAQFANAASANGLGDIIIRAKGTLLKGERSGLAVGLDVRAPTGDEFNFLGSGAVGVKPFVAFSTRAGKFSPHLNGAFQWNGNTVLAGDVLSGRKGKLPNEIFYAAGADIGVTSRLTFALDVLGSDTPNAQRVNQTTYLAANGSRFSQIAFRQEALRQFNGSTGLKLNVWNRLLVSFNVLYKLNDDGLRARVVPLFGASFTL